MYRINGEITEKIEYCRHLESGSIQVLNDKEKADAILANQKCFPLDSEVIEFNITQYIADMLNGVNEDDIPAT